MRRVSVCPPPPALEKRGLRRCVHDQPHPHIEVPDAARRLFTLFGQDLLDALAKPAPAREVLP